MEKYAEICKEAGVRKVELKHTMSTAGRTFFINMRDARSVSVWPHNGTVFAAAMKAKGGGWLYKRPIKFKNLSPAEAVDMAIEIALKGEL